MADKSGTRIRILVVRHGETDHNVQGIIQGQLDTDLNAKGRRQAYHTGRALAHERIDEIYSSPLKRAKETAMAIASAHPHLRKRPESLDNCSFWVDDRFMERGFGSLEGYRYERSKKKRDSIPGIEQEVDLRERLASGFNDVLSGRPPWYDAKSGADANGWADEDAHAPGYKANTQPAMLTVDGIPADLDVLPALQKEGLPISQGVNEEGVEKTILVVGHGASLSSLFLDNIYRQGYARPYEGELGRLWNCSMTRLYLSPEIRLAAPTRGAGHKSRRKEWDVKPEHVGRPEGRQKGSAEFTSWADISHFSGLEADINSAGIVNADEVAEGDEKKE